MSVSQLGYIGLRVSDIPAWEAFGTEVLGMEVSGWAEDGAMYLRMDEHHHRFALHPSGDDDLAYVGWQTATATEYEETKAKLREAGVGYAQGTAEQIGHRRVVDLVTFEAGGIPMEVYYGGQVLWERRFRPGRPITGFKTGELGLGHVGLRVGDPEEVGRLLLGPLGFKVSDHVGPLTFYHCNPRQHTVVLSAPGEKRIGHFMIELNSLDDVGTAMDLCEDRNIPINERLGKHTNDHMVSFYMRSPSGWSVEYGWGGRTIDDSIWQVQRHERGDMWGHRKPVQQPAAPAS